MPIMSRRDCVKLAFTIASMAAAPALAQARAWDQADDAAFHARMVEAAKIFNKRLREEMKDRYRPSRRAC